MSLPIPNNREQIYLSKIINKDLENIPIPLSRLEIYFKCLLDGDVSKLPVPMSRKELILRNYILDVECDVVPVNRTEVFLKALKSVEVEGLPTPQSKLEVFLDYIIRNGCLEKYEYYPFIIRDYLNVKNTPKAKMRFKGMKGNTLVNEIIDNTLEISRPKTKQIKPNTTYTVFVKKVSGTGQFNLAYFNQDIRKFGDFGVIFQVHTENIVYIKKVTTPSDACFFGFYIANGDIKVTDVMILEGDHTQNPPPYFEGMKSFGDDANKIEVLSVGKNLFDGNQSYTVSAKQAFIHAYPVENNTDYTLSVKYNKGNNFAVFLSNTYDGTIGHDALYSKVVANGKGQELGCRNSNKLSFNSKSYKYMYVTSWVYDLDGIAISELQLELGTQTEYKPYQSSKAIPMYRNSVNELVPVPVLRGKWDGDRFLWGDEILLHDDGKLYYHKRCESEPLNFDGEWILQSSASGYIRAGISLKKCDGIDLHLICDKLKVDSIAQANRPVECIMIGTDKSIHLTLSTSKATTLQEFKAYLKTLGAYILYVSNKEEVYPCELSEQLYSYDEETNIFINGGAVVGETTIEIGTKLGPIVDSIRQEARRTTNALEGLVAHGVQECAYQLYPEDFEKAPSIIEGEENA